MSPLVFKLIRITAFALAGFVTAKIFVKYSRKRNRNAALSDPETILIAVFFGAIFSGLISFLVKGFFL